MEMAWHFVLNILIALAGALLFGLIAERLRINSIIGYILAGAIVGQGGLGLIAQSQEVNVISELGVALLLFTIGLEFSFKRLLQLGRTALLGGTIAIISTLLIFSGILWLLGVELRPAVILGTAAALSSTAIVLRVLRYRNTLDSQHGKAALGVLLMQDVALVPLVLLVTFLSNPQGDLLEQLRLAFMNGILLLAALLVFTSYILPRFLNEKIVARNREIPIILAAVTGIGATYAAHTLGISPALGAFLAGMMLAENKFAEQMRADVTPMRTLFITIFFVSVGLLADLTWMATHLHWVIAASLVTMALKTIISYFSLRPFMHSIIEPLAAAVAISQLGEFSFMLLSIGQGSSLIPNDIFQLVISTSIVTLVVAPFAAGRAGGIARRIATYVVPNRKLAKITRSDKAKQLAGHIVLIGYGEAGQAAYTQIADLDIKVLVLDIDPKLTRLAESAGALTLIGDATNQAILEAAHIEDASGIIVAVSDPHIARRIIGLCTSLAVQVPIFARSRYHIFAEEFNVLGSNEVVDEELLVGEILGNMVRAEFQMSTPD